MPGTLLGVLLQAPSILALSFLDVVWGLLAVVVFFVGLLLIVIILVQDSKDSGLTGAFGGAGGGGSALLGARMQKGLAKMTAALGVVFALCCVVMVIISNSTLERSIGEDVPAGPTPVAAPEGGAAPGGAAPEGGAAVPPAGDQPPANE